VLGSSSPKRRARSLSLVGGAVLVPSLIAAGCSGPVDDWDDLLPRQVRISEIHYHDPTRAAREFVEISNSGPGDVVLSNWCIEGAGFCFEGRISIGDGERIVVDAEQMEGSLRDSGEELRLIDGSGTVRDVVSYLDDEPWPAEADGLGYSLQLDDLGAAENDVSEWSAAAPTPGSAPSTSPSTSGEAPAPPPSVAIVEFHYHDPEDDHSQEFVELLNTTERVVDLSGWTLRSGTLRMPVAPGTTLPPGGRHVLAGFTAEAGLSNGSSTTRLLSPDGSVVDALVHSDTDPWPALADGHGHSLHRIDVGTSALDPGNWFSAPPTRGTDTDDLPAAPMPVFSAVTWTRSPLPSQPVRVSARLRGADGGSLSYRVGFGEEVLLPLVVADGIASATIPPQPAGSLVRFRLSAEGTVTGSWPRQGDGSRYAGTVVTGADPATALPVIQWFMEPGVYGDANSDRTLNRDEGYPLVFAYDGLVFDNSRIRMKGQQSRFNSKHKWKIILPAGHEWDEPRFFGAPADELALNAMSTDKSYVREILTSDLVGMIDGWQQRANPVRVQRNGEFQGVYVLTEQPDKSWRSLQGLSGRTVVWKAERQATMQTRHLSLKKSEFSLRYRRLTQRWNDGDGRLRELIRTVNLDDEARKIAFAYASVDVPQVINMIAAMRVAQHFEWDHKNYEVLWDPEDERWRLLAIDHDLNMGSRWHRPCGSFCWESLVYSYDHFKFNRFGALFIETPEFRSMLDRRTKTIAETFFAGDDVEQRVAELANLYGEDDDLDVREWHAGWGKKATDTARSELLEGFVARKREQMVGDEDGAFPPSQPPVVSYDVAYRRDGTISVTNNEDFAIDLSGMEIPGLPSPVPAGVVLNRGRTVFFTFERVPLTEMRTVDGKPALVVWVPGKTPR